MSSLFGPGRRESTERLAGEIKGPEELFAAHFLEILRLSPELTAFEERGMRHSPELAWHSLGFVSHSP